MKIFRKDKEADKLKYEFLPSALEISETPASPLGSFIIKFIFFIILSFILWASIGKVDIVAVGRGKVIPYGKVKVVQTLEEGIITEIFVEEGEKVKEGEELLSLDTKMKEVDEEAIKRDIKIFELENEILNMYLKGKDLKNIDKYANDNLIDDELKKILMDFSLSMNENYKTQKDILFALREQASEELNFSMTKLKKLRKSLKEAKDNEFELKNKKDEYLRKKADIEIKMESLKTLEADEKSVKELYDKGELSEKDYNEKKEKVDSLKKEIDELRKSINYYDGEKIIINHRDSEEYINNIKSNLELQEIKVKEKQTKLSEADYKLTNFDSNNKLNIMNKILENKKEIEHLNSSLVKAKRSMSYKNIKSPVNGVVQGISHNTIGGVVKPAESIVSIVPDNTPLIIEAMVQNKDIGYVEVGQKVSIKVDAYSFQKYGFIDGVVEKISPDAIEDKKSGLVYRIKISVKNPYIEFKGKKMNLSSGMSVVAEIKTGKRRIIEFLLEPLVKYTQEAFQVR